MIAGTLEVQMLANLTRLSNDMNKAKSIVSGTAKHIESAMNAAKVALAGLGAGLSIAALTAAFQETVKLRSALDDLSDTTGDTVTMLDGLRRQAHVSGVAFESVGSAATKLARNLNNADEEGAAAAEAIKVIGLELETIRAMKPAEAMMEVAKALDQFEDGAGKVAVAVALMGKEGAKMLPFLKDLVNDGDAAGKITAEQAAQAEKLEKEWRRLTLAFQDGRDAIATDLIPWLRRLIEDLREGTKIAGGFMSAILSFGTINPFRSAGGNIVALRDEIAQLEKDRIKSQGRGFLDDVAAIDAELKLKRMQKSFLEFQQRQDALLLSGPGTLDARDLRGEQKKLLNPGNLGGKEAKARAERDTSAQDYAKALEAELRMQEEANRLAVEFVRNQDRKNEKLEEEAERYRDLIDPMRKYERELEAISKNNKLTAEEQALAREIVQQRQFEEANKHVKQETEKLDEAWKDLGLTFASAFEDAIVNGKKFSEVLKGLEADIARILARKLITEPLANSISGALKGVGGTGVGGFFSNLFNFGSSSSAGTGAAGYTGSTTTVPGLFGQFATGTDYVPQTGPYLLHKGEAVVPANENEWEGGGGDVNLSVSIDARGADAGAVQRIELAVDKLRRSIIPMVTDAKRRNAFGRVL